MIHRFKMDAVEHIMSKVIQTPQNCPKSHVPVTSVAASHGITSTATNKSDMASETTKKLVTFERRWWNRITAARAVPEQNGHDQQEDDAADEHAQSGAPLLLPPSGPI